MGMLCYIMCRVARDSTTLAMFDENMADDNFITTFGLEERSESGTTVALLYFAFTSLSTVGLGDYHPRSNIERLVGAFVLLFGVALTSYVMETLSMMLVKIQDINRSFD